MKVTFGFYGGAVVALLAAESLDQLLRRRSANRSPVALDHFEQSGRYHHHRHHYRPHSPLRSKPGHPTRSLCSRRSPHLSGGFSR